MAFKIYEWMVWYSVLEKLGNVFLIADKLRWNKGGRGPIFSPICEPRNKQAIYDISLVLVAFCDCIFSDLKVIIIDNRSDNKYSSIIINIDRNKLANYR